MYTQLYFHTVRRIYDRHLKEFLQDWLTGGRFGADLEAHLRMSDSEVLSAIRVSADDETRPGHISAQRIAHREHFRLVYEMNPADQECNPNSVDSVESAMVVRFGTERVRRDKYLPKAEGLDFPIYARDGRILSSLSMSKTLQRVPDFAVDCLYIHPEDRDDAQDWLQERLREVISGDTGTRKATQNV